MSCADGDRAYNQSFLNKALAAGASSDDVMKEATRAMGVTVAHMPENQYILPRGKALYGLARASVKETADTLGATWSLQHGRLQVTPMQGYLPGEAIEVNAATGMVGMPEQTDQGIRVRTLINPRLRVGGLVPGHRAGRAAQ